MADMMPKEQYNFIHGIEEWMLKATNMTDNEAYDFAFRVWQCQNFLARYLSADVAPVVRCKDCKYWNKHSQYGYDSENGVYGNYCMIWTPEDDFYAVETPEDGFCYEGKRKDNESVDS